VTQVGAPWLGQVPYEDVNVGVCLYGSGGREGLGEAKGRENLGKNGNILLGIVCSYLFVNELRMLSFQKRPFTTFSEVLN